MKLTNKHKKEINNIYQNKKHTETKQQTTHTNKQKQTMGNLHNKKEISRTK